MTTAVSGAVAIVAGARTGTACGVSDYARQLAAALAVEGVATRLVEATDWSLAGFVRLARDLERAAFVHLQHPTTAFQRRLGPYLLFCALRRPRRLLTLHEFSRKGRIGTWLSAVAIARAHVVIVSDQAEHDAIRAAFPWAAGRLRVVPIGSNIPAAPVAPPTVDVVHFGQIRAGKGIELFLDTVERLGADTRVALIGGVLRDDPAATALLARARALGVELVLDAPADAVAARLAATRVCLLPFPDGISERRGSALAAMANGAVVVTTPADDHATRALFAPICTTARGADALAAEVGAILAGEREVAPMVAAARAFVAGRSWPAIARAHAAIYAALDPAG